MQSTLSRRRFLRQVGCSAGSLPVLNTMLNLKLAGSLAAAAPGPTDYRALVCLFFSGGIDSFNVLVPRGTAEYAEYKTVRGDLGLAQNTLLPLTPTNLSGLQLGLHPGLPGIKNLFETGKAAFIANVGTLVEPVTKDQWNNGGGNFPLGLYSHSDQQEQWQTSMPDVRSTRGWAGRAADLLHSLNGSQLVSMNISLSGGNVWQSGQDVYAYTVGPGGAEPLYGYNTNNTLTRAVNRQLALTYQHLLTDEFARKKRGAIDTYQAYNNATDAVTLPALPPGVSFNEDNNYLGSQLQRVAKTIAAQGALGHKRQTFFIDIGGWDMHDNLIKGQADYLPYVDEALTAFYQCLVALGMDSNVTTFSASDFARTLSSNGNGSDHAWGSNQFVFGGAVKGRKIYGTYPELFEDSPLDIGRGAFIPTTSVDSYFAELALWLGVPNSSMGVLFPNIVNFPDPTIADNPMDFLA